MSTYCNKYCISITPRIYMIYVTKHNDKQNVKQPQQVYVVHEMDLK